MTLFSNLWMPKIGEMRTRARQWLGQAVLPWPPKLYLLFQFLQWWAPQVFRVKSAKTENKEGGVRKGSTVHRAHNPARKHALLKNCRKKLVGQELGAESKPQTSLSCTGKGKTCRWVGSRPRAAGAWAGFQPRPWGRGSHLDPFKEER